MRVKKVKTKNTKPEILQTLQFTDKKEKMLKSLEATIFNISESCKSAGISRNQNCKEFLQKGTVKGGERDERYNLATRFDSFIC